MDSKPPLRTERKIQHGEMRTFIRPANAQTMQIISKKEAKRAATTGYSVIIMEGDFYRNYYKPMFKH
jgi:hypothetical protein